MAKEDSRAAIALYILFFFSSWSWVAHRLHPLSFGTSIFSLFVTAGAFVGMSRIIKCLAPHCGWKKIGWIIDFESESEPKSLPLYLQAVFEVNLFAALFTAESLSPRPSVFMCVVYTCLAFLMGRKWYNLYKATHSHGSRSLR